LLTDVVRSEVIGLAHDRTEKALVSLLRTSWTIASGLAVKAVCIDMHHACANAVAAVLPKAEVVFDKLRVVQHGSDALDDLTQFIGAVRHLGAA
jgi:hypothetical protein